MVQKMSFIIKTYRNYNFSYIEVRGKRENVRNTDLEILSVIYKSTP